MPPTPEPTRFFGISPRGVRRPTHEAFICHDRRLWLDLERVCRHGLLPFGVTGGQQVAPVLSMPPNPAPEPSSFLDISVRSARYPYPLRTER